MSKPIGYICENCGSTDIVFDAHAEWDHINQRMELRATYDHNSCASCGEENSATEVQDE